MKIMRKHLKLWKEDSLFREYAAQSTDPVVTEIILTQAQLNKLEMGLLNARHEHQTDIAKLTGRIDDLESKHRTCQ